MREDDRPAVGRFEASRACRRSVARIAAGPEQLSLEERLHHGGTVDNGDGIRSTCAHRVQRVRGESFPGPRFAADQDRARVRRQAPDQGEDVLHRRTAADHPAELEPAGDVRLRLLQRSPLRVVVTNTRQQRAQPFQVQRLAQVVDRTASQRLDDTVIGYIVRHERDATVLIDCLDPVQQAEVADVRPPGVDQHQLHRPLTQLGQGVTRVDGRGDVIALSQRESPNGRLDVAIAVDDEDARTVSVHGH